MFLFLNLFSLGEGGICDLWCIFECPVLFEQKIIIKNCLKKCLE